MAARARTAVVLAARAPIQTGAAASPADDAQAAALFRIAAQGHALKALEALAWLVANASSEAVRVSAANALIDRAHGRPAQAVRVGGGAAGEDDAGQGVELTFAWLRPETS